MNSLVNYFNAWGHIQYEQLKDRLNATKNLNLDANQKQYLSELNTNGVVVLSDYYSHEKCEAIIQEIDRLIDDESINVWRDDDHSDNRVYGSHLYSDLIHEFYDDQFLAQIGEAYLKAPIMNSHTLGARLNFKPNNQGSGGGWHRDSVYKVQYKSIAYLTDVNKDNGPFEYLLGTHKKSSIFDSILHNNFAAHQNRMTEQQIEQFIEKHPQFKKQVFTAKKGTVILVDTSGIHRGMPIQSGERYALTNYFFPKHHYNKTFKKKFEKLF